MSGTGTGSPGLGQGQPDGDVTSRPLRPAAASIWDEASERGRAGDHSWSGSTGHVGVPGASQGPPLRTGLGAAPGQRFVLEAVANYWPLVFKIIS